MSLRIITFKSIGYENQSLLLQKNNENCCDWPLYVIWFIKDNNLLQVFSSFSSSRMHDAESSLNVATCYTCLMEYYHSITLHTAVRETFLFRRDSVRSIARGIFSSRSSRKVLYSFATFLMNNCNEKLIDKYLQSPRDERQPSVYGAGHREARFINDRFITWRDSRVKLYYSFLFISFLSFSRN